MRSHAHCSPTLVRTVASMTAPTTAARFAALLSSESKKLCLSIDLRSQKVVEALEVAFALDRGQRPAVQRQLVVLVRASDRRRRVLRGALGQRFLAGVGAAL